MKDSQKSSMLFSQVVVTETVDTRPVLKVLAEVGLLDRTSDATGPDGDANGQP
jgi:hypothetical protein